MYLFCMTHPGIVLLIGSLPALMLLILIYPYLFGPIKIIRYLRKRTLHAISGYRAQRRTQQESVPYGTIEAQERLDREKGASAA